MQAATYYLETYGCTLNSSDSELIAGLLQGAGFIEVKEPGDAGFIILNTCGVKTPTEQKMLHQIRQYSRLEGKILVIAGCLPLIFKKNLDVLRNIAPNFGAMVGPKNYHEIPTVFKALQKGASNIIRLDGTSIEDKMCLEPKRPNKHVAILAIAEGCVGVCTYCCTRFARGILDAYPARFLVERFTKLIDAGTKEIFLTAEDCSAYFDSRGDVMLPDLIDMFLAKPGDYRIRLGMMNPRTLLPVHEHLIRSMHDPRVFTFIHVPVQSGSDRILKAMNRQYKIIDFVNMMDAFKVAFPGITIDTDIICGFPGETDEDFQQTVSLMERVRPDIINISMYGHRPGTAASKLKQVPSSTVKARTRQLTAIHEEITRKNNERWLGWEGDAIIEEYNEKTRNYLARNRFYKPIIVDSGNLGEIVRVKITGTVSHVFTGTVT
ncbi:MAG: tRNA (N(6)-L-threonylcarbamoyladenosine(37)-C(2))-methylthiotransferase [Candidatus Sigynarchaeota archaeon]